MESRRLFTFLLLSMAFLWFWTTVVAPPPPPKKPTTPPVAQANPVTEAPKAAEIGAAPVEGEKPLVFADHPAAIVMLGSTVPDDGYALGVTLNSAGATIDRIEVTAPQFRDLQDESKPAQILNGEDLEHRTFATFMQVVDAQLAKNNQSLASANWKVADKSQTDEQAKIVFEFDSPDGTLRLRKTFTLPRIKGDDAKRTEAYRYDAAVYTIGVDLDVVNLSDAPKDVAFELQGPAGVVLENQEHTSKYRDIHVEFVGGEKSASLPVVTLQGYCDKIDSNLGQKATPEELLAGLREDYEWTATPKYVGIDVQFFGMLIAPIDDRTDEEKIASKKLDRIYPMLSGPDIRQPSTFNPIVRILKLFFPPTLDPRLADVSFRLASTTTSLAKKGEGDTLTHKYAFFAGPKRRELLDQKPFEAAQVLNYGMFGFVARGMHYLLDTFYGIGLPYFLAIILLTVLVRSCLFPISRKQAIMAARQKELQPQVVALKEKYGDDKQKLAQAQMELWRKNGINPFSGCLPLFIQLPIFIGLYTALNSAVDLRLQKFLWIDNLAGPDALFRLPFALPLGLGSDFSVFPLVTVVLFLLQQKMFMPPAQDEQQEMQYKIMNIMTGVMGIMFWHQPAGLCLYFIASSLWSIAERKLLGSSKPAIAAAGAGANVEVIIPDKPSDKSKSNKTADKSTEKPTSFFARLMEAAQEAQRNAEQQREKDARKGKNGGKSNK